MGVNVGLDVIDDDHDLFMFSFSVHSFVLFREDDAAATLRFTIFDR